MSNEIDEIESGIRRKIQVALIAGLRVGQELALALKERLQKIQQANEAEARELQAAFDRDRDLAAAELAQTGKPEWWEKASPDDIGRATALADAWEPHLPGGAETKAHLFEQLEERYGIRTYETGTSPDLIAAQLKVWEQDRLRDAQETGSDLTDQAAAEVQASATAQQQTPKRQSKVRFVPVPGSEEVPEPSRDDVLAQLQQLPPQEELSEAQRETIGQWARQDPNVDAAIWRKYPDVYPSGDVSDAQRLADQERGQAHVDLAAANLHAQDADHLAAEARTQDHRAVHDSFGPAAGEADKLRTQAADAEVDSDLAYDSAERRELDAEHLEDQGVDQEAVHAQTISDTGQAKPARDAVKAGRATKARPNRRAPSRGRGVERGR